MKPLLQKTCDIAVDFLESLPGREVGRPVDYSALLATMGGNLPQNGEDPLHVIEHLAKTTASALVASPGPRYFGFVIGGSMPAALAADWLTSTWDQNAVLFVSSPAAAAAEEISRRWVLNLLGLPVEMTAGFTTGATMANFTALAAARHAVLKQASWDVEERGLFNAPEIAVVTSAESHVTIFASLQMLGLGRSRIIKIATDSQGRMRPDALRHALADLRRPLIVCAQAGNVNAGAFDPVDEIAPIVRDHGGWLHVDGAFGAWAAVSPRYRHLTLGIELADSITLDSHKWLNVPYDSGLVLVRNAEAHHQAMTLNAPYYVVSNDVARDNTDWVPESSRRARGFTVYAALRSLGRIGVTSIVERCCQFARQMADRLSRHPRVQILNEVVLNQVLVRFHPPSGTNSDAFTAAVIRRVQEDGTCWIGGTTWQEMHALRIAVSNWSTTETDIDASADAILRCASDSTESAQAK
jgi:glutamate/tyrosine decarboxylase-like PLP-dependent enzyme